MWAGGAESVEILLDFLPNSKSDNPCSLLPAPDSLLPTPYSLLPKIKL
ncbi:hypothetical protein [Moorena sp. SIO1F2]|nr:hypothetical protein [Moorena sp. SIO1F2]